MSLVGPRPERVEHVEKYTEDLAEFEYRLKVRGGLTGYAQIYGKYNTSPYDKLQLDLIYIQNYSIFLDIKLILMTIKIMFMKESTEGFTEEQRKDIQEKEWKKLLLNVTSGYGGAEQAVIAQANLLVEKYNVEIISFYKLYENPAFEVDPRIEIKYLTENVKPNREEIKKAISAREVGKIVKEGIKSLKILYWRKYKMQDCNTRMRFGCYYFFKIYISQIIN